MGRAFTRWFDAYLEGAVTLEASRIGRIRDWAEQVALVVPDGDELAWFDAFVAGYRTGWVPFPDVDALLKALPPLPLGVVTNGHGEQQRAKLAALGMQDRFDAILVSEEFGAAKPDPTIFLAAAERLGVAPQKCLMVGDLLDRDIAGALAAGMRAAWVQRPDGPEADTVPPADLIGRFTTVSTLPEICGLLGDR